MKPIDSEHGVLDNGLLSVLSVEPYGMKQEPCRELYDKIETFSALGRAVWDETRLISP